MTKFNKFFIMALGLMTLGLSACASVDRSTASSQEEGQHYKPQLFDRQ